MKNQAEKIPYVDILRQAAKISWKHKYLWWFGLFISLLGSLGNISSYVDRPANNNLFTGFSNIDPNVFVQNHPAMLIAIASVAFILLVIFLVLSINGQGALIKLAGNITENKPGSYSEGYAYGKKYFWSIFKLNFLLALIIIGAMIVLFMPVFFLVSSKSVALGFFLAVPAILICIIILTVLFFIKTYGSIYVVLGDLGIQASIENATALFQKNISPSIIMGILLALASVVFSFGLLITLLPIIAVLGTLIIFLNFVFGKIAVYAATVLCVLIVLALIIAFRAIFETFFQTAWVLFFKFIASPKEKEVAEPAIEIKTIPAIDAMKSELEK